MNPLPANPTILYINYEKAPGGATVHRDELVGAARALGANYNAPQNLDHCISEAGEGRKEDVRMTTTRRQHSGECKAKVTLAAIRGERTLQELAAAYGVHPVQIAQWKNVALEELPTLFSSRRGTQPTGVTMGRSNQVWRADITSIRVASGCVYLVAVLDWVSR